MNARLTVTSVMLLLAVTFGCTGPPELPADLSRAVAVVGYLSSPRYINISMYSATAETGAPSEFVSYLFSSMGAAERPESASEREPSGGGQRGGRPTWPDGIAFTALKPDPRSGKQVVVIPDDARSKIIVEGYVDPKGKPVLRQEFDLAKPIRRR